ncbi:DUF6326 family protein [Aquimarina rubra]|uniref:DUF6326 family protein n=1 Tax=Aquimarina rubra TaxID=1920033 RepID=A0ABW5L966_9FLAO
MLENQPVNIKIKMATLWITLMFLYIYGDYFELYTPSKVEKLMNVTDVLDSPVKLFVAAVVLAIPAFMIAFNIFLKPAISRILNILFGSLFTLVVVLVGSTSLYPWYSFYVFYAFLEALVTIYIVWQAWKWPKENI